MEKAIVLRPVFEPRRRIITVSDIHGNLPFFLALMDKVRLTPEDILVLNGDLLEKGQDSLPLLRHLMALSSTHTLYPVCGNCDGLVLRFFDTDELDARFFSSYLPRHPESTLRQLARERGFDQTEDLPRLRRDLRAAFPEEWAWLSAMPTILETEHLVFVHGGIPSLEGMEELDRWRCMKNDDFLGQGHSFDKWVIVGHWPVTLYNGHIPSSAPLFTRDRKIISIDGACVLKADGQLNALLLPSEDSEDFAWTAWDGLPAARALDPVSAARLFDLSPKNIALSVFRPKGGRQLCRRQADCQQCRAQTFSKARLHAIFLPILFSRRKENHDLWKALYRPFSMNSIALRNFSGHLSEYLLF